MDLDHRSYWVGFSVTLLLSGMDLIAAVQFGDVAGRFWSPLGTTFLRRQCLELGLSGH